MGNSTELSRMQGGRKGFVLQSPASHLHIVYGLREVAFQDSWVLGAVTWEHFEKMA